MKRPRLEPVLGGLVGHWFEHPDRTIVLGVSGEVRGRPKPQRGEPTNTESARRARLRCMVVGELDDAIDALVRDVVLETHPAIDQVVHGGPLYFEACNALSKRVAVRFLDGDLSFWDADAVMNWVWGRMTDQMANANTTLAEPAMSIYEAFDAGEFHHRDDDGWVDPVEKYTRPKLKAILSHRSEQQPD